MTRGADSARRGALPAPGDIFGMIHIVHRAVKVNVDTALTWEQLSSPEVNYSVIRPLIQRFSKDKNHAIIYVLMVNRIRFLQLASGDLAFQALNTSRASMCEMLAIKLLRTFADSELELVSVLTKGYCPLEGAPDNVWDSMGDDREDIEDEVGNALEMSIVSSAKRFLATPLAQKVINLIHSGQIVYTSQSSRSIINDSYTSARRAAVSATGSMSRTLGNDELGLVASNAARLSEGKNVAVYVYDPRAAGWLDQGRLRIPKYRSIIEFINFSVLTALFVLAITHKIHSRINGFELAFIIYALGFSLDEFAATNEHGWTIYLANAWNAFDITFISLFVAYLVIRIVGLLTHKPDWAIFAFNLLSTGACILLPRLCFFLIKDNVIIISLKAMIADFVGFMSLAAVCFSGFLFTLYTMGKQTWKLKEIAWLLLLTNTLLVTILISILSNRYAAISANAKEEHLFQRASSTIEGVKADSIFLYLPPLNIIALIVISPLSWVLNPHALHRLNVFAIRVTSFPILLAISLWERYQWRLSGKSVRLSDGRVAKSGARQGLVDGFLGSTSENLIANLFESAHGMGSDIQLRLDELGPEDLDSKKSLDVLRPEDDGSSSTSKTQAKSKTTSASFTSPLGKLFSKVGDHEGPQDAPGNSHQKGDNGHAASADLLRTHAEEFDDLRRQLDAMRDGQDRLEEMLRKFVSSGDNK
ncbi:hypothetical protein QFC20_001280 [Naganishia adeliensis]|uniref:Uncharacterized protein n=1 Tax=Naganishia adeliensis TaxID=92952 RepID=A0ACC2WTD7_9TREE|nr:hypothetical protein QFC20_001280 [Naganishia adeliensis]